MTKTKKDSSPPVRAHSLPFQILKEKDFFILVHRERPSWVVTNEVGKEIAEKYFQEYSQKEIAEFLRNRFYSSKDVDRDIKVFLENLKTSGFIGEPSYSEVRVIPHQFKGILFLVTQACNLSCYHCSVECMSSVSSEIGKDDFCRIVDESASLGGRNVLISGGEPLVRPDIFELIQYASQAHRVSLLTNGILIGKKEAEKLKRTGVSEIVISLDGASPKTHDQLRGEGNFEKVLRGIEFLRGEELEEKINFNYCLSKININEAIDFLKFVETIGVKNVNFLPVKKVGRASGAWEDLRPARKDFEKFIHLLYETFFHPEFSLKVNIPLSGFHPVIRPGERISTCPFGTQLVVNGEGDIYSCPALFIPQFHLGNVLKTSLRDALNSDKLKELRKKYRSRIEEIPRCRNCVWRSFCQGGCTSSVYLEKDTFWDTDDLCDLRDRLYRKAILTAARKKGLRGGSISAGIFSS